MAAVVRYFAVNPDARPHIRRLERATGLWPRSLKNELDRLARLGILTKGRRKGRVHYRLEEGHPAWPNLRGLVRHLSRPVDILRYALAEVSGVDAAFLYGSYAKGTATAESDVDVFVLGDSVSEEELTRHSLEAGVLLGREIDTLHLTRRELKDRLDSGGRFLPEVLGGKKQWLVGSAAALGRARRRRSTTPMVG